MKRVQVLIPFHNSDTKKDQVKGDIIKVSDEKLAKIREINVNMVLVLGDVEEVEKEDELEVEDIEELIEDELEVKDVEEPKVKKTRTKKTATKE